jgi:transcriptional regulator with XRE-family HTH domain
MAKTTTAKKAEVKKAVTKKATVKSPVVKSKGKTGIDWLRARMSELGYKSLEEVAAAVGINRGNLYRYFSLETRPSVALLPDLCKALKASPAEVLKALEILRPNDRL